MNLVIVVTKPQGVELPSVEAKQKGQRVEPGYHPQKLIPGENDVDSDYWDKIKGNPAVKMWLACKILVNQGEGKAKPLIASLDTMSPDVALRHIGNCESVEILNDWKAKTSNPALSKAIVVRIQELVAKQDGAAESAQPVTPAE